MAENKNKEFKWNFNLDDTDSDFTDIDFSSKSYEPSDKDIQPIIFVRDETSQRRKTTSSVSDAGRKPAAQSTAKRQPASAGTSAAKKTPAAETAARKTAAARKPAAKKKKSKGGIDLNWRLIALIAAAVLVVALVVVLFSRCGKKVEKAWTRVEADSQVKQLMDGYFSAKKEGDASAMRKVLVTDAVVNASLLSVESNIYKDYTDIELQQYPGISKNETVICATYDTELSMIDASVPSIGWFYALPGDTGSLRLMTTTEMEKEENKSIYDYVLAAAALLSDTTVKETQQRYNNAVSSNDILAQYLQAIKDGNWYDFKPSTEASTEDTVVPPASTEAVTPVDSGKLVYVNASSLRMRSGPTTEDDNVIWNFSRGYCLTVIGETDGWYRVKDDVKTNPGSNYAQAVSGYEGYVSKDWVVSSYDEISWP
ncbi:MAG: SH3 domain-containing protein [Lachnospiraceae bacterium]|nr:SH3 domain-containing protein [Lachnospiraceae bacterium]